MRHHKLAHDPLASLKMPNAKADRRYERRMLLPREWPWVKRAAEQAGERFGMSGTERVLLYAMSIQTGLRANELRGLRCSQMILDTEQPHVLVSARATKNRKNARQYIQPELAARLKEHVSVKMPSVAVFAMPDKHNVAEMLRTDLADARELWVSDVRHDPGEAHRRRLSDFLVVNNHKGETLDFHSLRHSCGAWLALSGAHPKAIQTVMRHSTITLTMDTYGHLVPGQEAETVARFPSMTPDEVEAAQATGTDDAVAENRESDPPLYSPQLVHETDRLSAEGRDETNADVNEATSTKPAPDAAIGDVERDHAAVCDNAPGRTRTCDPRFRKTPSRLFSPTFPWRFYVFRARKPAWRRTIAGGRPVRASSHADWGHKLGHMLAYEAPRPRDE